MPDTPRVPAAFPVGADLGTDTVVYGPDAPTEAELRLLGDPAGKRILLLGVHDGHTAVALARRGARVIAIEPSERHIDAARWRFNQEGVAIELHHGDLAGLASVRADAIDVALSVHALSGVDDLARVFRQVHRVLRPDAPFVFSLPHPAFALLDPHGPDPLRVHRPYWDDSPRPWRVDDQDEGVDRTPTIATLFTALSRANFRVDVLLEPEPSDTGPRSSYWTEAMAWVPSTLIVRARKQGL
ncbi:MAG TPA: class I SAM-dependent methyltransferase [Acidimicrobiales bacterium]|nr:class I SAM-dependent methyltransferase [Acidimicrobiales bacterium]